MNFYLLITEGVLKVDYQLTYHEAENIGAERNLKAFKKLEKSHTDEAYKAYRKAQSTYISV